MIFEVLNCVFFFYRIFQKVTESGGNKSKFGILLETMHKVYICFYIRVYGITRSVSSRRWEGDGFDARPKPRHS